MLKESGIFNGDNCQLKISTDSVQVCIFPVLFALDNVKGFVISIEENRIDVFNGLSKFKLTDNTTAKGQKQDGQTQDQEDD